MKARRPTISQRRPIFVGCEGESEQGYARLLQDLAEEQGLHVHLTVELLKAGDPLARIQLAVKRLHQIQKTRNPIRDRFVLLDTDQLQSSVERANQAKKLAADHNIKIIWQEPCFEAVILRHFVGRTADRPPNNSATNSALRQEWPEYRKPMNRFELTRRIDRAAVQRAASVERALMELLKCIGLC